MFIFIVVTDRCKEQLNMSRESAYIFVLVLVKIISATPGNLPLALISYLSLVYRN